MNSSKSILVPSLLVLGCVFLGLCAFLLLAERYVDRRTLELERELGSPPFPRYPASGEVLQARLLGADAYLDQRVDAYDFHGAPASWGPEQRPELEKGLASLGSFFEQVDSLLDDKMCKYVLREGKIVATDAPRLGLSRQRTNVLCAQALVDLDRPDGSPAAAARLAQALDLIRLSDDGKVDGYLVSIANESIVLDALQRVLARTDVDRAAIRDVLGDRLKLIAGEDRLRSALEYDFSDRDARVSYVASRNWPILPRHARELIERNRLVGCVEETITLLRMSGADACKRVDEQGGLSGYCAQERWAQAPDWLMAASQSHLFLAQRELARTALDVAAQSKESPVAIETLPRDPFSGEPFVMTETGTGVDLRAEGALAALRIKPGDTGSTLLCWSIPR